MAASCTGIFPAVTTKFAADDRLDTAEMERCVTLQVDAGTVVEKALASRPALPRLAAAAG